MRILPTLQTCNRCIYRIDENEKMRTLHYEKSGWQEERLSAQMSLIWIFYLLCLLFADMNLPSLLFTLCTFHSPTPFFNIYFWNTGQSFNCSSKLAAGMMNVNIIYSLPSLHIKFHKEIWWRKVSILVLLTVMTHLLHFSWHFYVN